MKYQVTLVNPDTYNSNLLDTWTTSNYVNLGTNSVAAPSPSDPEEKKKPRLTSLNIILIVVGSLLGMILLLFLSYYIAKKTNVRWVYSSSPKPTDNMSINGSDIYTGSDTLSNGSDTSSNGSDTSSIGLSSVQAANEEFIRKNFPNSREANAVGQR